MARHLLRRACRRRPAAPIWANRFAPYFLRPIWAANARGLVTLRLPRRLDNFETKSLNLDIMTSPLACLVIVSIEPLRDCHASPVE